MKTISLALSLFLTPFVTMAALQSEDDVRKVSDQFMEQVKAEQYEDAFALLKPIWPLPEADYRGLVATTNEQMRLVESSFGKVLSFEFIRKQSAGDSLLQLIYLQKLENTPIRWVLTFYKPVDTWLVNSVSWDDTLESLFVTE